MEASLNVARDIQRGFMPRSLPQPPGYDLALWWFPNAAVGGDYCDVFPMPQNRLGLVIADVCGHGLGPSLIMATVRAALRALLLDHDSPDVLLELLDRAMAADLDELFVTMVLARLDSCAHQVEFANAGHAPAIHYSAGDDTFRALESTATPLGVLENATYPLGTPVTLHPGDLLLLCTDGIVEAIDSDREQFGQQRLEALLRESRQLPAAEIVARLSADVQSHFPGEHPDDDLTVLLVKRNEI
jgi:serine phosphatase RsbU (regulator of sigma subunit)